MKKIKDDELPIFKTSDTFSNMRKDRFVIPQPTTLQICQSFSLNKEAQERTVNKLVDRTPDWLDMEEEEQKEGIKATLVLETVAQFLYTKNHIQDNCTMYENGYDKDGNIVLDAFYVKDTKVKNKWEKAVQSKKSETSAKKNNIVPFNKAKKGGS